MSKNAVLTKKIKQLLHKEISDHFADDPIFSRKLKVVNQKSDLEDFTYGILFRNVSATPNRLGLHNYSSKILSHVSIAKVGNNKSAFINLVEEDALNKIFMLKQDVSNQVTGQNRDFLLGYDPIMQDRSTGDIFPCTDPNTIHASVDGKRSKIKFILKNKIFFEHIPPAGSKVEIGYAIRRMVPGGYYFLEVTDKIDPNTYQIHVGAFAAVEKERIEFKIPVAQLNFPPEYLKNNPVSLWVDGQQLEEGFEVDALGNRIFFTDLPPGNSLSVRSGSNNPLSFPSQCSFRVFKSHTFVERAIGNENQFILPWGTVYDLKVFSDGAPLTRSKDFILSANRLRLTKPLGRGSSLIVEAVVRDETLRAAIPIEELFASTAVYDFPEVPGEIHPGFIEVFQNDTMLPSSNYIMDYENKKLTMLKIPGLGTKLEVTYRLPLGTFGPYDVRIDDLRTDILPGVKIYFNNRFEVGDKVVVIVGSQRKVCADEYGGRWDLSVEMATISDDPIDSEDLIDKLAMFLEAELKLKWDAAGLFIGEVQIGGESNEEKDESTSDVDFQSSINLTVSGEWTYRIPRKFRLLSLSYSQEVETEDWDVSGAYLPFFSGDTAYLVYGGERP